MNPARFSRPVGDVVRIGNLLRALIRLTSFAELVRGLVTDIQPLEELVRRPPPIRGAEHGSP